MTILNETVEKIQTGYTWGLYGKGILLLLLGLALVIVTIYFLVSLRWKEDWGAGIFLGFFLLMGLFIGFIAFHTKPVYKEVPQYEVLLDEEVPFRDIYENYEIIDQRGQIFVLRDKGWDDE